MKRPLTIQEWIHWLEAGRGARVVGWAALILGGLALSLLVAWKQFEGPVDEATLRQADLGRQLANGEGFSSSINYPQAHAYMEARGGGFEADKPMPELYEAPLYSMVIAGALKLFPGNRREAFFAHAPVPPDGYGGDYFLLGLNLVLFWFAVALTYDLGRRFFEARVGAVAALGLLLSVAIWKQVVAVNGVPLMMVLSLLIFRCWWQVEQAFSKNEPLPWKWLVGLGASCGLLFLTEYSAGVLVLVVLGYLAWRVTGRQRWGSIGIAALAFVLMAGPWVTRNMLLTGNPVALAWQNMALKSDDPTAEPETLRTTMSAELPRVDWNKLGNKVLTSWQENLEANLWSGGAMWFMAFFAVGWLYAFRSASTDRLRWMFTLSLIALLIGQATFNSGESVRIPAGYLTPLIILFGAGFFFVLVGSNTLLSKWPRVCAVALLAVQALPLLHDALEPRRLHFSYPPYYPGLFMGMREELARRDSFNRFGTMADVPAGVAWYGRQRVWAQPKQMRDFFLINTEQSIGQLLLTPKTLDRPFFSDLAMTKDDTMAIGFEGMYRLGDWGRVYAGLMTGKMPNNFPLKVPQRLSENLYVLINPALPPVRGK